LPPVLNLWFKGWIVLNIVLLSQGSALVRVKLIPMGHGKEGLRNPFPQVDWHRLKFSGGVLFYEFGQGFKCRTCFGIWPMKPFHDHLLGIKVWNEGIKVVSGWATQIDGSGALMERSRR